MPHSAVVVFTGRPVGEILHPDVRGSGDWRLDPVRARLANFLVCTRNHHSPDFPATPEPHRSAFLIGRIADVVISPDRPDRWLIKISEYNIPDPPISNIWAKSGHLRYPVRYTTLEELGIDLATLPPFSPLPGFRPLPPIGPAGLSEVQTTMRTPITRTTWQTNQEPGRGGTPVGQRRDPPLAAGQDMRRRMDAILGQIDRIPDLPAPFDPPAPYDPLEWDGHGLPQ